MPSALLVTGNIRTFENCLESFERLCRHLNPDVFLCLSNRELDLHPYVRETIGYSRDRTLSLETFKLKLSPWASANIKKIIIVDREEEDRTIEREHLAQFDTNKSWTGIDIFKQFYKINLGLDAIQSYEKEQNITYDYILKTRFDIMIDINSIPIVVAPNELLVVKDSPIESVNDHIFICNGLQTLKKISSGVIDLFIKNIPHVLTSIHTMLGYICKENSILVKPILDCSLNREFHRLFDTSITIVTMFYDIGRQGWDSCNRGNEIYFKNCEKVLKQRYPLYIFTTEEFKDRCIAIRQKTDPFLLYTQIIIIPYTNLTYYKQKKLISEIQEKTNIDRRTEPEYTKPDYIIVIFNKLHFMNRVSIENPYQSTHFQWIDFGIHDSLLSPSCNQSVLDTIVYKPNTLRLCGFLDINPSNDRTEFYSQKRETVAATLLGGDAYAIQRFYTLFEREVETLFTVGLINQEQYVYYCLLCQYPELFDYIRIQNWNELEAGYFRKNSVRVALCFSGHMRSYTECRNNINEKIMQPLQRLGLITHSFLSSWNTQEYQGSAKDFLEYEFEEPHNFEKSHNSNKWETYSQYSGPTTCPNAVSMHYKISKVYKMATEYAKKNGFQYDIIIRVRPDTHYNHSISPIIIRECLLNPKSIIYMPYHHGKYEIVTKFISDQFFLGHPESMKYAMTVFNTIDTLLKEDCPHTGEGFLWKQLELQNIHIKRFTCSYALMRNNNVLETIV